MSLVNFKKFILQIVRRLNRLLLLRSRKIKYIEFKDIEYNSSGYETFFGYHDITPFSLDNSLVLACRTKGKLISNVSNSNLEIGYYDLSDINKKFNYLASTFSWCWQQSCRLQWVPKEDSRIIYNTSNYENHICRIIDINSKKVINEYNSPIYSINNNATHYISINFSRLQRFRPGYGYSDIKDKTINYKAPDNDGLYIVDFTTGEKELLISLKEISENNPLSTMREASHYFNHILWSPDSKKFFFLHLWVWPNGKRFSRAYIYNIVTQKYSILLENGIISHHCWVDPNKIIIYCGFNDNKLSYYLFDLEKNNFSTIGHKILTEDGHPSLSNPRTDLLLTDTYPNKLSEQSLLIYNIYNNNLYKLASYYHPLSYRNDFRCDLHPRWSNNSKLISIDSAHKGQRSICIITNPIA
ncbi:hypothetical protein [Prochlorococcus sp. MIT 1011]|uniref:hypothetical protein n=1 Tax=Prochlorococcus sp. MIT 1011 TaxID=3082520 RepID=UPI0039B5B920